MDSYLLKAIGQDRQDKENIAQGSKEKGDALGKEDDTLYRPSSWWSDLASSIGLAAEGSLAAGEKNPVNPVNSV